MSVNARYSCVEKVFSIKSLNLLALTSIVIGTLGLVGIINNASVLSQGLLIGSGTVIVAGTILTLLAKKLSRITAIPSVTSPVPSLKVYNPQLILGSFNDSSHSLTWCLSDIQENFEKLKPQLTSLAIGHGLIDPKIHLEQQEIQKMESGWFKLYINITLQTENQKICIEIEDTSPIENFLYLHNTSNKNILKAFAKKLDPLRMKDTDCWQISEIANKMSDLSSRIIDQVKVLGMLSPKLTHTHDTENLNIIIHGANTSICTLIPLHRITNEKILKCIFDEAI